MSKYKDVTITVLKTFKGHEWGGIHDAVLDAIDKDMTQDELIELWHELPSHIQATALSWGMSDTVFGDQVFEWVQKNKK